MNKTAITSPHIAYNDCLANLSKRLIKINFNPTCYKKFDISIQLEHLDIAFTNEIMTKSALNHLVASNFRTKNKYSIKIYFASKDIEQIGAIVSLKPTFDHDTTIILNLIKNDSHNYVIDNYTIL